MAARGEWTAFVPIDPWVVTYPEPAERTTVAALSRCTQSVPVDSKRVSWVTVISRRLCDRAPTAAVKPPAARWLQLVFGILCMVMIANLQYGWTLFVGPIDQKFHWGSTAIQVAFTIFILTDTWLVPFEGYLIDCFGPRLVVLGGGVLVAVAWITNSFAKSLPALYIGAGIGGAGAGAVYGTAVGNSLKWFTDRRGLAAGLTAAGFGAGTALTVPPIHGSSRPRATKPPS